MEFKADRDRIYRDIEFLTSLTPSRSYDNPDSLEKAAAYIEKEFSAAGGIVGSQYHFIGRRKFRNVICSFGNEKPARLIVGAHYDSCSGIAGADDNASGVAGLLECARLLNYQRPETSYGIDLVAYCPEEPPFFGKPEMGSAVHARSLKESGINIIGMICLDMIGYFSGEPGSQLFPGDELREWFPDKGNFIIVAGRSYQAAFTGKVSNLISRGCKVKAYPVTDQRLKGLLELSDHRNYINAGFNAVMINDTAMMRNLNYHTENDTIEKLDLEKMAGVVDGCYYAIVNL